jgi:hypothetical protein
MVTADARGGAAFKITIPTAVSSGHFITATATGIDTSEFSRSVSVDSPVTCSVEPAVAAQPVNGRHTVTVTVLDRGAPVSGVSVDVETIAEPYGGCCRSAVTDAAGQASFTYENQGDPGVVFIAATGVVNGVPFAGLGPVIWRIPDCNRDPLDLLPDQTATSSLTFHSETVIEDVNVGLYLTYTAVERVSVFLTSPNGTTVELFSNVGGAGSSFGSGDSLVPDCTIDDQAKVNIADGIAPFIGRFQSEQKLLGRFNGENAKGRWTLKIVTNATPDSGGFLGSWCLEINDRLTF